MFLTRQLLRNNNLNLISKRNQKFFSSTPFQHSNTNTKLVATTIAAIVGGAAGISYITTDVNNNGSVLLAEDVENLTALSKKEFKTFPVVKNEILSKDTNLITFQLPSEEHTLGLTVASCLSMSAEIDGKTVFVKSFTHHHLLPLPRFSLFLDHPQYFHFFPISKNSQVQF